MADTFLAPGRIISGRGALSEAAKALKSLGGRALIVTDGAMERLGNLARVTSLLEDLQTSYAVYAGVNGEPDDGMVEEGVRLFKENGCDFLIALGGGSPIDAMKAVAMTAVCGGKPADYTGKSVEDRLVPMAAIPTTAGTGSEATQFTIITDRETEVKMLLKGPSLMPDLAIIDPLFTVTAPPGVTSATGVDALTHAIEAFTSRKAQPLSDTFAASACRRIFGNLERVYRDGEDVEGRIQMSLAALEAGLAFNNSSVTLVHGMSRPIGAMFHVPHGLSNAMLLKVCLDYAAAGALDRFAVLSRECGLAAAGEGEREAAGKLLARVERLLSSLEIPTPGQYGIDREEFMAATPKMAGDAYDSGSPSNTRREITVEAMEGLYRKLWENA